jgi:single-strand DNA-binding protein
LIGSVPVACKSGWGDNEKTTWVTCKVFGEKRVPSLANLLKKGAPVTVQGEFSLDTWEHEGKNYSKACLVINDIKVHSSGPQESQAPAQQAVTPPATNGFDESDIPF